MTQPRRIAATTLAERVAFERGELVGDTVGVTIRFLDKTSERTHIKVTVVVNKSISSTTIAIQFCFST